VRILLSETYSISAHVKKNRICMQTVIAETANSLFAAFVIILLSGSVVQSGQIN